MEWCCFRPNIFPVFFYIFFWRDGFYFRFIILKILVDAFWIVGELSVYLIRSDFFSWYVIMDEVAFNSCFKMFNFECRLNDLVLPNFQYNFSLTFNWWRVKLFDLSHSRTTLIWTIVFLSLVTF